MYCSTNSDWDVGLIWICSWLKSPHHPGFRFAVLSPFRESHLPGNGLYHHKWWYSPLMKCHLWHVSIQPVQGDDARVMWQVSLVTRVDHSVESTPHNGLYRHMSQVMKSTPQCSSLVTPVDTAHSLLVMISGDTWVYIDTCDQWRHVSVYLATRECISTRVYTRVRIHYSVCMSILC